MRRGQNKTTSPSSQSLLSNAFELREEDLFALFSEQLPDSMYLLDLDDQDVPGKIIYTNDAACRPIGTRAKIMIGRSINELDKEDEARKSDSRLDKLRSGEVLTFEVERRRKDGTSFLNPTAYRALSRSSSMSSTARNKPGNPLFRRLSRYPCL